MGSADDAAAEGLADGLMSEANAQQWSLAGKVADQRDADPGFVRSARSRRDDNSLWLHCFDFVDRDLIVSADLDVFPQLSQILDQVVGERIVIIEDEDHVAAPDYESTPKKQWPVVSGKFVRFQSFKVSKFQGFQV
jgi:hypothetical protein